MALKRLSIQNFRNLHAVDIKPSESVNLLFGENGSGKTSVLEAINVLGLGRSFRSHKHKALVTHDAQSFTVFGKVTLKGAEIPLGISRSIDGESTFKANGAAVDSAAVLASYLPIQIINSESFQLLDGGPKVRRQFIDWLVFHVEPKFFPVWRDLQRCLKHRNSLLRRDRMHRLELAPWDQELARLTEQIHEFRQASIEIFLDVFSTICQDLPALQGIDIAYFRGWDKSTAYAEALVQSLERDCQHGFTRIGAHRADLRIQISGVDAGEVLSRGQQKLLVCALKIAQGYVFSRLTGRKCIYLVDDLPAELDKSHRELLAEWLGAMESQVFVTGIELEVLRDTWRDRPGVEIKLFHVEQGKVTALAE